MAFQNALTKDYSNYPLAVALHYSLELEQRTVSKCNIVGALRVKMQKMQDQDR